MKKILKILSMNNKKNLHLKGEFPKLSSFRIDEEDLCPRLINW